LRKELLSPADFAIQLVWSPEQQVFGPPKPKIIAFNVTPQELYIHGDVTLSWELEIPQDMMYEDYLKTLELEIDHGVGRVDGKTSIQAYVSWPTTYTLTVRNKNGDQDTHQTHVNVIPRGA